MAYCVIEYLVLGATCAAVTRLAEGEPMPIWEYLLIAALWPIWILALATHLLWTVKL